MAQTASPFSKLFQEHLNDLERRALKTGINMTAICKKIGISRSTPDRWRRKNPRTLQILEQMEKCVAEAERKKSASAASAI